EQAFVASLASCHMLWFLHLACRAGHIVERYVDEASGVLAKGTNGRMAMTRVTLYPVVAFSGTAPSPEVHAALHDKAHAHCFIANSVTTEVVVQPRIA
ncbi:MAG: OsmC family protein, partial [Betaproteobacteria bacterium]|nr:OsmC family protein [Betaproteobacteria bacterium]